MKINKISLKENLIVVDYSFYKNKDLVNVVVEVFDYSQEYIGAFKELENVINSFRFGVLKAIHNIKFSGSKLCFSYSVEHSFFKAGVVINTPLTEFEDFLSKQEKQIIEKLIKLTEELINGEHRLQINLKLENENEPNN